MDLPAVEAAAEPAAVALETQAQPSYRKLSETLDEAIARRVRFLTDYQDAAYAARYRDLVEQVRQVENQRTPGRTDLTEAVARNYIKVLAYKDEYEVARLYTDGTFLKQLPRPSRVTTSCNSIWPRRCSRKWTRPPAS